MIDPFGQVDSSDGLPDAAALAALIAGPDAGARDGARLGAPLAADAVADALGAARDAASVSDLLDEALVGPARELVRRPSKRFRARLLRIGYQLCGGPASLADERRLLLGERAVELLHAGSLIVDDIQDGSSVRRGAQSLHLAYGVPGALCTGNWLYFWPLRLISAMRLDDAREHMAFRLYHDALERAHYGQALDLAVKIDALAQGRVPAVCEAVTALKTGALTALAMQLGALAGGAAPRQVDFLGDFGRRFGTALQRLDDLGNARGKTEPEKQFEDLVQRKPSAIWALAAARCDAAEYQAFKERVLALPREGDAFLAWLDASGLGEAAAAEARDGLARAFAALESRWPLDTDNEALRSLRALGEQLIHAYG